MIVDEPDRRSHTIDGQFYNASMILSKSNWDRLDLDRDLDGLVRIQLLECHYFGLLLQD